MSEDISPDVNREAGDYPSFKPGQRLKKARELRGLSLDQVVAELRLSRRIIEGMESDDYSSLPEPAFVRGYMRRYAQLVKLSPDDIAARFDESYSADTATPQPDVRPRNPVQILGDLARPRLRVGRLLSWASLAVIALLFTGFFWARQDASISSSSEEQTEPAVSVEVPVPAAPTLPVVPDTVATVEVDGVLPSPSGPSELPLPVGMVAPPVAAPASVVPVADSDVIGLVVTADSWVSVRDARGHVLMSAVARKGETLSLAGVAPFAVSVGNAPGIALSINGKSVDMKPHTRGAVATLTVAR